MRIPVFVEISGEPPFDAGDAMRTPSTVCEPRHMERWKPEEQQGIKEKEEVILDLNQMSFIKPQ